MIKVYISHIVDIMIKNILMIAWMFLLVTISAITVGSMYEKQQESKARAEEYKKNYEDKYYYWTAEAQTDQEYVTYSSGGQANKWYKKLTELKERLYNDKRFSFFTSYSQPIYLKEAVPDIFLDGYEEGNTSCSVIEQQHEKWYFAKALLVSEKFFEVNHIVLDEGQLFETKDYVYNKGKKVPVLLGNAYKEIYKVGDVISADYLFEGMDLQVAGFIKEKNFYLSSQSNEFVSLERYILLPAFQIDERTEFSSILSLMELNGGVISTIGLDKVKEIFTKHLEGVSLTWKINVHDYSSEGDNFAVNKYSKMTKQVEKQFQLLLLLVLMFSSIGILLNVSSILEKNKYIFGIEMLCGASYKDIIIEAVGLIGIIFVLADVCSCVVLMGMNIQWKGYVLVQMIMIGMGIFAGGYGYRIIKKMKLAEITGGYE